MNSKMEYRLLRFYIGSVKTGIPGTVASEVKELGVNNFEEHLAALAEQGWDVVCSTFEAFSGSCGDSSIPYLILGRERE